MAKGKRYDGQRKLNLKKVFGVIIAFAVLVMIIISIVKVLNTDTTTYNQIATQYFSSYTNGKWGVIDQEGKIVIENTYDEMIVVPNSKEAIFICIYEVDDNAGTYKTKVINEKNEEIFTNYELVEAIDNYDSKQNIWFEENVLRVKKDGKYGLIDFKDNLILPCEYDEITALKSVTDNLLVKKGNKVGLVNNKGQAIINVEYTDILLLEEGYTSEYIVKNKKYGIVSTSGTVILEPKYDSIKYVGASDSFLVKKDNKWNLINNNGEILSEQGEDETYKHVKGENIIFEKNNKYGIKKANGESVIDEEYESLEYAFSVYYIAKRDGRYGIININNEEIKPFEYTNMYYIEEGNIIVADRTDTETVILDNNLAEKLTGIISEINIEDGYIKIYQDAEYKYYNFKFEEKDSKDILRANTLYLSKKDGKYGYKDKGGNLVVNYIYEDATEQNGCGFVAVKQNGVWGSLNKIGNISLEPSVNLDSNIYIDFIGEWHLSDEGLYYIK